MKGNNRRTMQPLVPILLSAALLAPSPAKAGDRFTVSLLGDAAFAVYGGSETRDSYLSGGLLLRADYLDRGGFTIGYHRDVLTLKDGIEEINQDDIFLSGRIETTLDALHGSLIPSFDLHFTTNDDTGKSIDTVRVYTPRISYLNLDRTLLLSLGFTRSVYPDGLHVDQWTPTVGFGSDRIWLQLKGYRIDPSEPERVQRIDGTSAVEAKLTIWTTSRPLGIESFHFGLLAGERVLAADADTGILYNLTDLQKGAVNAGIRFRLTRSLHLPLFLGVERYENKVIDDSYQSSYLYVGLLKTW